jgi:hypothetical protein
LPLTSRLRVLVPWTMIGVVRVAPVLSPSIVGKNVCMVEQARGDIVLPPLIAYRGSLLRI